MPELEGSRTQVEVSHVRNEVVVTRAIRRSVVKLSDVEFVRAPPWGRTTLNRTIALKLRTAGHLDTPEQLVTGLTTTRVGDKAQAVKLAEAIGVPVASVWPDARSDGKKPE